MFPGGSATACHSLASIRAAAACFSALLAMVHLVFSAFVAACPADLRALPAECGREFAPTRHIRGGNAANLRAIHIHRNAARHHFDVLFGEACSSAMIACGSACVAGIDACLKVLVSHDLLQNEYKNQP
jgi:hypothetical protein